MCCVKGQTLINGQCSIPLERTEEEKREIQRRENCLGNVKNIESFRKLSFLPKCERTNEFALGSARIKLGQVRGLEELNKTGFRWWILKQPVLILSVLPILFFKNRPEKGA